MQFPIIIGLRRSRFLDAMLLLIVSLTIGAILGFPCSWPIRTGLLFATAVLGVLAWRALTPAIKMMRLERSGNILIELVGETGFVPASPRPGATVHPWLSVIGLNIADGRCRTLIAAVDSLTVADFRRLRVFMRWQVDFSGQNGDA